MRLQVSGLFYFDSLADMQRHLTKFLLWKDKGWLMEEAVGGDYYWPRYVKDYTDVTPPPGPYKLAFRLRLALEADKDAAVTYYNNHVEPDINKDYPGYFEGHKCFHDEGLPCKDVVIDEW